MKRKVFGTTFTLLLVAMAFYMIALVNAQFTDMNVINPATQDSNFIFNSNTATEGSRFNATVWLSNVTGLFAYQVNLNVTDDSLLNITDAWLPTEDPEWVFADATATVPVDPAFYDLDGDNSSETVKIGSTILVGDTFSGDGLLCTIEFEILYAPTEGTVSCNLDIDNVDSYLLNFDLDEIPTGKNGGYYEYEGVPADETPPVIHEVYQQPANDSVTPTDKVMVYANVTDDLSGVKQVILNYTTNNGTWFNAEMMLSAGLYNASIPEFPYCNDITYVVIAEDNADNTITTEDMGYTYTYHVIPEFPIIMVLLLAMILATIAVIISKKRLLNKAPLNRFSLN